MLIRFMPKLEMILDGKVVAQKICDSIKNEVFGLEKKPRLGVILVGDNPSSLRYVDQKQKWASYIGIEFKLLNFKENIKEDDLLHVINKLNSDEDVDGFIVQLPLPNHIDEKKVLNSISPEKDVDGLHPINQGKVVIGDKSGLEPCTPAGIVELFKYYNIDLVGKNVTIIGRSNIVGKPTANLLINLGATVTVCNSKTKNIEFYTKNSDIVITAVGSPKFLTKDKINSCTVVIDVGFSIVDGKICGDADFENIVKNGNDITPVPGGVGTLTVAMLMKNTLKAYNKKTVKNFGHI